MRASRACPLLQSTRNLLVMATNQKRPRTSSEEDECTKKSPSPPRSFPWSLTKFFSAPTKEEKGKEYWQNLSLDEKRKQYKCGKNYVTLADIPTWPESQEAKKNNPPKGMSPSPFEPDSVLNSKVSLWKGDITRLEIDAIVNAANSSLMGGGGVDGAIHAAASVSLQNECYTLGGCDTGDAKLSTGHRLPAKFILHTVGPIDCNDKKLHSCYESCLQLVLKHNIRSVAFCCIATGVYGFPNEAAAKIALHTVRKWLGTDGNAEKVDRIIFTVFLNLDQRLYSKLLHVYFPLEVQVKNGKEAKVDKEEEEEAKVDKEEEEETKADKEEEKTRVDKEEEKETKVKEENARTEENDETNKEEEEMEMEVDVAEIEEKEGAITEESSSREEDRLAYLPTLQKSLTEPVPTLKGLTAAETTRRAGEEVLEEAELDKKEMAETKETSSEGGATDRTGKESTKTELNDGRCSQDQDCCGGEEPAETKRDKCN